MTRRKRVILVSVGLALVVCAALAAGGAALLVKNVPGVARLVSRQTARPSPRPARDVALALIPTLTVLPATPATPNAEPSPVPSARSTQTTTSTVTAVPGIDVSPTATLTVTQPPPTRPARREWIAFESKRGKLGDYEICVMATNGSRLTNLTNSWADDVAPAWSPDGRWIAFVSLRDTLSGKAELEGGNLYLQEFDPAAGKAVGEPFRLTDYPGAEGWPAWSPDGRRIAFHADIDGNMDIWVINVDGTGLVNLTKNPAEDQFPAWSPDGKQIAFASTRDEDQYDVWLMAADGSGLKNLTRHPARDRYPIWSPDGRQFTFNTDRDGKQEIYIMNVDGSGLRNVTRTPRYDEGLADWSPDGRRLVLYSEQKHNKDIYVVDLATGKWTNLTNHEASDEYCAWWP